MQKRSSPSEIAAVIVAAILIIGLIFTVVNLSMQRSIPQVAVQAVSEQVVATILPTKQSGSLPATVTNLTPKPPTNTPKPPTNTPEPPTNTPEPPTNIVPTVTPKLAASGTSRSNPLLIGTEIRFKNWTVTITGVVRGKEAVQAITSANQLNKPAPKGWQYLLASLTLTNISTEQEAKSVLLGVDLRVTGDRNVRYSQTTAVVPKPLKGDLFPNGSAKGQIAFLVPADEGNLLFFVAEAFSFELDARRFVAIDEGATMRPDPALSSVIPTDAGTKRDSPAPLGTTTVSDAWEITVLEVVRSADAARRITEANQFNQPAPKGQEYILARVRAHYLGSDDPDTAASIDQNAFKVTGASNVIYDRPSIVSVSPNLEAYLFPGGQIEGWVVVQVPTGEARLTLVYAPVFEFSKENQRFLAIE